MEDRIPRNPGRVLITPEDGGAAYYATMTRADNPEKEGTPLNKNTLLSDATASLLGLDPTAVPDDAFAKLGEDAAKSVHWIPVANTLGELAVGEKITLNETIGGVTTAREFIVADKNYNGTGRVLMLRNNLIGGVAFGSTHNYADGTLDKYCNETYLSYLDADVRAQIANVSIKSASGNTTTVNTLSRKCFALSGNEFGFTSSNYASEGARVAYFDTDADNRRKGYLNGTVSQYWTRTPIVGGTSILCVYTSGSTNTGAYSTAYPVRPAFTLPADFAVSYTHTLTDATGAPIGINAKVAYGSYKGAGTYGQSNACSLTFDFVPAIVIIQYGTNLCVMTGGTTGWASRSSYNSGTAYQMQILEWGTTIKWYDSDDDDDQFNNSYATYRYVAIG